MPTSLGVATFSTSELMVAAGARELHDGELAVVGLGIPQVAAALAQLTHAPRLRVLNEIGLADPHPIEFGVGNADPRHWYRAAIFSGFVDVMGMLLHRGLVDVGFLGALEVDEYGNANATEVPRADRSRAALHLQYCEGVTSLMCDVVAYDGAAVGQLVGRVLTVERVRELN